MRLVLTPKTRKARSRLKELSMAVTNGISGSETFTWEIMMIQERVHFSSRSGPWWMIRPCVDKEIAYKFPRWVHSTSDNDFDIQEEEEEKEDAPG